MFGDNNQGQQLGDISNISLPGSDSMANSAPQAPAPTHPPAPAAPVFPSQNQPAPAPQQQDLSVPEIPEHGSPSSPATFTEAASQTNGDISDLSELKQQALSQLSPLVGHLDQTPEEKFRTTMMMIQASDDQTLIPQAYEAANAIGDEKAKAQALLDVVNEINYFAQKQSQ